MKKCNYFLLIGILVLFSTLSGCKDKVEIPNYETSQPSSIYGLRRVQMKDDLKFGVTAIRAVVTSDFESKNIASNTIIVQDVTDDAAIVLSLNEENKTFKLGDVVIINLDKSTLEYVDGELRVVNLALENIQVESSGTIITPKIVSLATLVANSNDWGPLLVRLSKINIADNGTSKLKGDMLIDDEIVEIQALFQETSIFAVETNPLFVESLIGIVRVFSKGTYLMPRNISDIQVGLLELLEDFELSSNTVYDAKNMNFHTGSWLIDGGITATSAADPKNGKQSIRLQGTVGNSVRNGIIAMNFDLKGVKSVSVSHGIYPAAAEVGNINPTVFTVEISKDAGQSYTAIGTAEVNKLGTTLETTSFEVNAGFGETVRLRIVNTSIPFSNNNRPRINIDDIHFKF